MYSSEKRPWMIPPEPVPEDQIKETFESEFVIIGAGYAGTFCSRKLMESGAKVTLLEKCVREKMRPNILGGSEVAVFNSKYGFSRGIPEYDPIDYILEFQKRSANRCNTDLVRLIANNSGEWFDWFIEPLPQEIKDHITIFNFPGSDLFRGDTNGYKSFVGTMFFDKPPACGDQWKSPWNLMAAMIWTLNMVEAKGVNLRYGTSGEYLEKNKEGRITGVIAKTGDGTYYRYNASKGIVLSCGDFGGNKEMVFDLLTEFSDLSHRGTKYRLISQSPRDGKGIRMGLWAGGCLEPGPRGGMYNSVTGMASPMFFTPFLRLNSKGKRYCNEGLVGMMAGIRGTRQPDGDISAVWDSNWKEDLRYQGYDHGTSYYFTNPTPVEQAMTLAVKENEQRKANRAKGITSTAPTENVSGPPFAKSYLYAADTFADLADLLGYTETPKENFVKAINRYNELCRKGRDEDFAKDPQYMHELKNPPYFATKSAKGVGSVMVTEAGLMVDEHQQVLDDTGDPISGLFATGQCAGEVFPLQYSPPISGSGIGTCSPLGYALGKYLSTL